MESTTLLRRYATSVVTLYHWCSHYSAAKGKYLTRAVVSRVVGAELKHYLGYEEGRSVLCGPAMGDIAIAQGEPDDDT